MKKPAQGGLWYRLVMRELQNWLLVSAAALTAGCVSTARFYPANTEAAEVGILKARYTSYGTGRGSIKLVMPDGEALAGEYSTVDGGSYQFGNVYASVYGPGGVSYGNATSNSFGIAGASPGIASMVGPNGSAINCEYFVNNLSGSGAGACKDLKGRLWRLHF